MCRPGGILGSSGAPPTGRIVSRFGDSDPDLGVTAVLSPLAFPAKPEQPLTKGDAMLEYFSKGKFHPSIPSGRSNRVASAPPLRQSQDRSEHEAKCFGTIDLDREHEARVTAFLRSKGEIPLKRVTVKVKPKAEKPDDELTEEERETRALLLAGFERFAEAATDEAVALPPKSERVPGTLYRLPDGNVWRMPEQAGS